MATLCQLFRVKRLLQAGRQTQCQCFYSSASDSWPAVPVKEVQRFIEECMATVGTRADHATSLANNLVTADNRGHYSHGLNRLDMYIHDIESGITVSDAEPSIIRESAATAHVDGNNVLGPVVGNFSMELAIQKAKVAGVGWVAAKGSNHFGIAGWYSMLASQQGLLVLGIKGIKQELVGLEYTVSQGMAFTNTSPLSVPTRARKATLGTNPLSLAAPAHSGDEFVLDMATTSVALGKIELHDRKGIKIPNSWGVDKHGRESNDPTTVIEGGGLMMLGGSELTGGYKGYGLAMLVEVFCGILSGSTFGPNIRKWRNTDTVANLGQCFIAIDPECFAPGFSDRMSDLVKTCRMLEPAEGEEEVLVAGDPERKHIELCTRRGGIPYHPNQIQFGIDLSKKLGVKQMHTV